LIDTIFTLLQNQIFHISCHYFDCSARRS